MKINVIVFAAVKEVLGQDRLEIDLHAPATVADLRQALLQKHPDITDLMDHCVISVDQEYSHDSTVLKEGCEVGVIPPVSGG